MFRASYQGRCLEDNFIMADAVVGISQRVVSRRMPILRRSLRFRPPRCP